jgi:signal transduction histidine kinase
MMEHFSFEELIEGQCRDVQKLSGIPIHTLLPEEPMTLPEEVILHTYRIVQELLTNASKYVKGHQVWIRILKEENGFLLSYEDDGPGFNAENLQKTGMGLSNIFERAKLLGGKATVDSKPGKGTTWKISIPFHGKTKTSKTIPA